MPNMQLCDNGHYYDKDRYSSCPYCKPAGADIPPAGGGMSVTTPLRGGEQGHESAGGKTVRLTVSETGVDPVVGWLVCVEGGDKGRDFRLHAGNNFVGRSSDRDVCLGRDPSVSGKHFSVSYDKRHDRYFVSMGEGKEIVYVNDEPLGAGSVTLQKGDRIEVAHTKLIFIPLDSELVTWEWEK